MSEEALRASAQARYRLAASLLQDRLLLLPRSLDPAAAPLHLAVVGEHYRALSAAAAPSEDPGPAPPPAAGGGGRAARAAAGPSQWTFDAGSVQVSLP